MGKVKYVRRKGKTTRTVVVDEAKHGTRRILEEAGYKEAASDEIVDTSEPSRPTTIPGLEAPEYVLSALLATGYLTLESLSTASDEDLLAVKGVGPKMLETIRAQLQL